MAKGKSQDQATVAEELKDQAPAIEQEPAEVTNQDPEQSGDQDGDEDTLVSVSNAAKSSLRQPSSGWVIEPGKTRKLLKDGWLENQLNAKLLVLV